MTRCGWVLLSALLLPACGRAPEAAPTGLETKPLADTPRGDEIPAPTGPKAGAWEASIEKRWTVTKDGGTPTTGTAHLGLFLVVGEGRHGRTCRLRVEVRDVSGVAGGYVSKFDGLTLTYDLDEDGRFRTGSLRFENTAPPDARSFLTGFWLGGFGPGTPWIPAGPLREGAAWTRDALGRAPAPPGTTVRMSGGGRLDSVSGNGEDRRLGVTLDALLDVSAKRPDEAVNVGTHDQGTETLGAVDGLPRSWALSQETRVEHATGAGSTSSDILLEVRGTLRAGADGATGHSAQDR